MAQAPERVFLQDAGDYDGASQFEVTWCCEPQDDADTEYIRADLVPQWQPIETAPRDRDILVIQTQNNIIRVARGINEYGNWRVGIAPMDYIAGVTHWMPLPAPPK